MKTLFAVDLQNDFLLNDGKLNLGHDTKELRERIASYIKDFKGHVVLTQDTHQADSCEFAAFPEHCLEGTAGWELVDEVFDAVKDRLPMSSAAGGVPSENSVEIIFKKAFSGMGLYWTLTEEVLKGEIFIVGVCSSICVNDLAISLVNFSKDRFNILPNVTILKEMVDDFNPVMAEMTLNRLQSLYGVKVI